MATPIFYVPRPMDKAKVTSVTSEATGHPIEAALDHLLDTYWAPTSTATQTIVIDLDNDMEERITNVIDRDFSTAVGTGWANNDITVYSITGGKLLAAATDTGQWCQLAAGEFAQFYSGHTYRITYDYVETTPGYKLQTGASQDIGNCTAGTSQQLEFTASADSTSLRIVSTSVAPEGSFDNFSIKEVAPAAESEVSAVALWIQNANTHQGAATLTIDYSDDNTNWTTVDDPTLMTEMVGVLGDPLRIYVFSAAEQHRYWRLIFTSLTAVINIGEMWLLQAFAPGIPDKYNRKLGHEFGQFRRRPIIRFGRTYTAFSNTVLDAFLDFFDACRGSELPLVLKEDSTYTPVRISDDTLEYIERDYQVYDITLEFESLPYVADGEAL